MREVLFEIIPLGHTVKVIAVDALTGIEVSIQGPASAGEHILKMTALRKLTFVLKKESKE